jgi:hypothetical protein
MLRPYGRIIPMHLIIIFGPFIAYALGNLMVFVVLMLLKTFVDSVMFLTGVSHPSTIKPFTADSLSKI